MPLEQDNLNEYARYCTQVRFYSCNKIGTARCNIHYSNREQLDPYGADFTLDS